MPKKKQQQKQKPVPAPDVPRYYKFAHCRLNHRWVLTNVYRKVAGGAQFFFECEGCGGKKHQYVTMLGEARKPVYTLPDGYRLQSGLLKKHFRVHIMEDDDL